MFVKIMGSRCVFLVRNKIEFLYFDSSSKMVTLFFLVFIYLFFLTVPGLSCHTQDLYLWHVNS